MDVPSSARVISREDSLVCPGAATLVLQEDRDGALARRVQVADAEQDSDFEETSLLQSCVPHSVDEDGAVRSSSKIRLLAQRIARSDSFHMTMALIILANTILMAVQVDHEHVQVEISGHKVKVWLIINSIFLVCFIAEITLRLIAEGCTGYFCHPDDWGWNLFDFLVILFGFIDQVGGRLLPRVLHHPRRRPRKGRHSNAIMLARMLRILRVLRVLRIFRAFKKLRMLAKGLVESVEIVFWIGVLVLVILFICAILCTTLIGRNVGVFPADEQDDIKMYWGSVARSMFTLFQFLTMDGWGEVDDQVVRQMPWMQLFFFPYIFFGAFVIMSLLTGVMADHMNDVRRSEEIEEMRQRVTALDAAVDEVKKRDVNHDGRLDRAEFQDLFDDRLSTFAGDLKELGLQLGRDEAKELFDWFDVDGNSYVTHDELRHGMKHFFEGLTPLQLFKLNASVRAAERFVAQNAGSALVPWSSHVRPPPSATADELLMGLGKRSNQLEERLQKFEVQARAFMEKFGWKDGKRIKS